MYRNCSNVTEYNLQRIVELSPRLRYIDGINAGIVSVIVAMGVISVSKQLTKLWIEPNAADALTWPFIAFQYALINFGPSVQELLPCRSTPAGYRKLIEKEF